jgi:hypothetical protein
VLTLTGDSLTIAFWTTILLSLMILFLTSEDVDRVVGGAAHWLWFSLPFNGLVLFFHFCNPTTPFLPLALLIVSLLHFIPTHKHAVARLLPEVFSLSTLILSIQWLISRGFAPQTWFHLPVENWLSVLLTLGIVITFQPTARIASLNIIMLAELSIRFLYTWLLHPANLLMTDNNLFNQYWLCMLLLFAANVSNIRVFHQKSLPH